MYVYTLFEVWPLSLVLDRWLDSFHIYRSLSMHPNEHPNGKKLKISRSTLHLSNYYIDRSDTCDSYNSGRIMKDTSNQMMMK